MGLDAVIASDPALIEICSTYAPGLNIHLSTQASATNVETFHFWKQYGLTRVVLAREVTMEELAEIRKRTDLEIEAFVHGAMCISYSGRCTLSNHMSDRDAKMCIRDSLSHVSGLNKTISENIVAYREENGEFTSRDEIKKVPRLGAKAFEQAAGFLRIPNAKNILDNTGVHPESYPAVKALFKQLDITDLDDSAKAKLKMCIRDRRGTCCQGLL